MRVAVVGSGPAGFYAAGALLSADTPVEVDLIERLPTPWGLVRLGVAPDHPKLKTVSRAFERIAERPGFRFLGNVEVGRDLHHADLVRLYDAVIYAVGAQTDRRLGIPGEDLPGSWAATELVAWYNGHPDYQQLQFDLAVERVVVIGNGNVALDVARMLALTHEELAPTDATDASIAAIASSPIREIVVVGRRGPAQAAFTTPELQEMGELAGADVIVDPADLEGAEPQGTNAERNLAVLQELAAREPEGKPRRVVFRFFHSPAAILGEERVEGIELVRNELDANERAVPTADRETLAVRARLPQRRLPRRRAAGRGLRRGERHDPERGRAGGARRLRRRLDQARPHRRDRHQQEGRDRDGRAPARGCRYRPARTQAGRNRGRGRRTARRARIPVVEYAGWTAIDKAEREPGEKSGRPRVKLCSWGELLATAERLATDRS